MKIEPQPGQFSAEFVPLIEYGVPEKAREDAVQLPALEQPRRPRWCRPS